MAECYNCGNKLDAQSGVYRSTVCEKCGRDVKVCLNCEFYASGLHWDCRESIDEQVKDKDRANFCSYFRISSRGSAASVKSSAPSPEDEAREQFNQLFND